MLISLSIENFKSFDKPSTFNMIASNKLRGQDSSVYKINGVSILKSAVIYGANASGKSNLIEALQFMKQSIVSSNGLPMQSKNLFCKNKKENRDKITTFEIRISIDTICYSYGFDVLLNDRRIVSEWIMELTKTNKSKILFKRENNMMKVGESLKLNKNDQAKFDIYAEDLSENDSVLFLSEMNRNKNISANSKLSFFKKIFKWFEQDLTIFSPDTPVTNFESYNDNTSLKLVESIIKTFDTGITGIKIKEVSPDEIQNKMSKELFEKIMEEVKERVIRKDEQSVKFSFRFKDDFFNILIDNNDELIFTALSFHHGNSFYDFDFNEESDGTRRLFDLMDILLAKNKRSVYMIDEMERSLHPSLTKHFIELLNDYHVKSNIQLMFTTHEATIMTQELFRRDQIWFVAKDKNNNSNLYPLDRFNERYDKKISKAYLEGRYGAIPIFEDLELEELP